MCHWKRVSYSAAAISTMWEPTTTTSTCCPLHPEPLQRCVEGNVVLGFAEEDQQCSPKITFSTKQGWFCCKEKTGVQCPPPCYYRKDMSYHLTLIEESNWRVRTIWSSQKPHHPESLKDKSKHLSYGFHNIVPYVLQVAEEIYSFKTTTYQEAISYFEAEEWTMAINKEMESLQNNQT